MQKNKIKFLKYFFSLIVIISLVAGYFLFLDKDTAREAKAGYLKLTETSTYFHVQSDVFGIRIYKTSSDNYIDFYDSSGSHVVARSSASGPLRITTSDSTSYLSIYDTSRSVELVENNKNRIVIKSSGKLDSVYGETSNYLNDGSNDISYSFYLYIYPDYFNYKVDLNAYDGIYLNNSGNTLFGIRQLDGYFDSGEIYYGTTTGEALAANYGSYQDVEYGAVLATSTPDFQLIKIKESYSGTTTSEFYFSTEATYQNLYFSYSGGSLKGDVGAVFAIRPKINTTASERTAWAAKMIAQDVPSMTSGSITNDWRGEVFEPFGEDGTYHLNAVDNKLEFNIHGETDAYALVSATTTGGSSSLSFSSDSGLADGAGTATHWAQVGNRLPYGTFDVNDPDVLFYWDMDSDTDGQAPNKGIGPITKNATPTIATGTAKNGLFFNTEAEYFSISSKNVNPAKGIIGFWFKPDYSQGAGTNINRYLFRTSTVSSNISNSFYAMTYNNYIFFYIVDSSGNDYYRTYTNTWAWQANTWYYMEFVWDAYTGERSIYVDDELISTTVSAGWSDKIPPDLNGGKLRIGAGGTLGATIDELYISSDPDQPDAPSYYDVISYTDKNGSSLTGIPETGAGSVKWNHAPGSPILTTSKYEPAFTVHDYHPKSASSTGELVDHLVLDLPLDGTGNNENAGKVYDKTDSDWLGTISTGVEFKDGILSNGAGFDAVGEKITIPYSEIPWPKGMISFDWIPDYDMDDDLQHDVIDFFGSNGKGLRLYKRDISGGNDIALYAQGGGVSVDESDFYFKAGDKVKVRIAWDHENAKSYLWLNEKMFSGTYTYISGGLSESLNTLYIGNSDYSPNYSADCVIDNFRIYNDIILPYGVYFTGANENGDYSKAHPDVVLYDDLESVTTGYAPKIGSGTVIIADTPSLTTGIDGVSNSAVLFNATTSYSRYDASNLGTENKFSLWMKPNWDDADTNFRLVFGRDVYNGFRLYKRTTAGQWDWSIRDSGGSYHYCRWDMSWNSGDWIHFETWYDVNAESGEYNLGVKVNGQDVVCTYTAATGPISITTWYADGLELGGGIINNPDCIIDEFYITDSQDTPQIPTAFGKPLIAPQLSIKSGEIATLKQVETDYDFAMLPDITSWLVRYKSDVSSETTFVISESLNTDTAEFDYNIDRNAPLLSTSYATGYSTITVQRGDGSWGDDFKLIFLEADAGVSSCYIGQGAAGSWGTNLCSATNMLAELSQNSVEQELQAGILNIVQSNAAEVIIRNDFVLPSEASTTETWHIFSDGSIVRDVEYTKLAANTETRAINSSFTNYAYYPDTPSTSRGTGKYRDSFFMHLSRASTDLASDYQNPASFNMSYGGLTNDFTDDHAANGFAEEYGAYAMNANYTADGTDCFGSSCGTPIYHTIGTTTSIVNVTTSAVNAITVDMWLVKFSGSPDLSGIHKRDRFLDGAATQLEWNIISINDDRDEIIVGNQEKNAGSPSALNTNQVTVGPWYTSLFAWEAAEDRDLTSISRYANGEIEMAECWPMLDTTAVAVSDWTTGENNFIKIYTPISKRHKGKWTEDSYRLEYTQTGPYLMALRVREDYVRISGLQIKIINNSINDGTCITLYDNDFTANNEVIISNNIFTASADTFTKGIATEDSDLIAKIYNNIFYDFSGGASYSTGILAEGGTLISIYNNTFVCSSTNCYGIRLTGGTVVAKNNLVKGFGNSNAYNGTFAAGTDYNATDGTDNIGVGTHNKTSQTFSFVDESGKDFHLLASDTGARSSGWNLSSDAVLSFSHDVDGQTRTERYGNWDIGADAVFMPSNKVKFEISSYATAYKPRFLINDWYPQSGKNGSEEGYIVAHLKAEYLADTEYLYDEISGSSTKFKINNYANVEIADSVRGRGIKISDNDAASIEFDSSAVNKDGGTISFVYTPDSDTADDNKYFFNFIDTEGVSKFMAYRDDADYVRFVYIGTSGSAASKLYDFKAGVPVNMRFTWKTDGDYARSCIFINNEQPACYTAPKVTQLESDLVIGNYGQTGSWEVEGILDDIKIYSDAILPYGAYYTGYGQNGDYLQADPSVLFYANLDDISKLTPQIGSDMSLVGSPTNEAGIVEKGILVDQDSESLNISADNIDLNKGSISFWFKPGYSGLPDHYKYLFDVGSDGTFSLRHETNGNLIYHYGSDAYVPYSWNQTLNVWYYFRITWSQDKAELFIDGQLVGSDTSVGSPSTDKDYFRIGTNRWQVNELDGVIDEFYITNNPRSQQTPTAFGKPLRMPLVRAGASGAEPTRQRYGKDYITSFTPDTSSVIIQYLKDTAGGIFEISEGAGTAQTVRLKGGIRLQGGVRF